MIRRLLAPLGVLAGLLLTVTALSATTSSAASDPAWTIPAGLATHTNADLVIVGASVTSPQGWDLAVFIKANHGTMHVNNAPAQTICSSSPADGAYCTYNASPQTFVANLNFRGTKSQVNAALASLSYRPDPGFPQPINGTLDDTILFSATEQNIVAGLTGNTTTSLHVEPQNQTPVFNTFPGGGLTTPENTTLDLSGKIVLGDPDTFTCPAAKDSARELLVSSTKGALSANSASGNGTTSLQITGTQANLNSAISSMHYEPQTDKAYDDTISVTYTDGGCVGYPGPLSVTSSFPLEVKAGPVDSLRVSLAPTATKDVATTMTVTAVDAHDQTVDDYSGTVHFSSTDAGATLPADSTLTNGVGVFPTVTFATAGDQTVEGVDDATPTIAGVSDNVKVSDPNSTTHLVLSTSAATLAGVPITVTVTAKNAANVTVNSDTSAIALVSTDGTAVLPSSVTLVGGVATFSATLFGVGVRTISGVAATDPSIVGTSGPVVVGPGPTTTFTVTAPSTATAGTPVMVTVSSQDQYGNATPLYVGTVHLSSDVAATLPADAMLVAGTKSFMITFPTTGAAHVTATDSLVPLLSSTSDAITVGAGAPAQIVISPPPAGTTTGTPFALVVTVVDQFGNTVTTYSGMLHFTSTDPNADLPADVLLVDGVGTFSATFHTTGAHTIGASDTTDPTLTGASLPKVIAAPTPDVTMPPNPEVTVPVTVPTTETTAPGTPETTVPAGTETTVPATTGDTMPSDVTAPTTTTANGPIATVPLPQSFPAVPASTVQPQVGSLAPGTQLPATGSDFDVLAWIAAALLAAGIAAGLATGLEFHGRRRDRR